MVYNIRDKLVIPKGMIKQFFGELQDDILMDEERDKDLEILEKVYGYKNIKNIIPRKVKLDVLYPILDKFFSYYQKQEEQNAVNNIIKKE